MIQSLKRQKVMTIKLSYVSHLHFVGTVFYTFIRCDIKCELLNTQRVHKYNQRHKLLRCYNRYYIHYIHIFIWVHAFDEYFGIISTVIV